MKKIIFTLSIIAGITMTNAQTYTPIKNTNKQKDNFSITVKESEKNNIDWKYPKEYFSSFNENDSIQISVKIIQETSKNLKSEKKYTAKGIKHNLEELLSQLKKMLKN